jgi:hypothetical protein
MRYRVTENQTALRRAGMTHEVVDSTHPSDGGPCVVCFTTNAEDAHTVCDALNLANRL